MFSLLANGRNCTFKITGVIHGIKNAKHIDTVDHSTFNKLVDNIIRVMAITQDVLPAKQHLLRCLRHHLLQFADPLPGIFTEITNARIKSCPTPALQGPESDVIELFGNGQHVVDSHSGREKRLVGITEYHFSDTKGGLLTHIVSTRVGEISIVMQQPCGQLADSQPNDCLRRAALKPKYTSQDLIAKIDRRLLF